MSMMENRFTIFSAPCDTPSGEGWFYRLRNGRESNRFYATSKQARQAAERALKATQ